MPSQLFCVVPDVDAIVLQLQVPTMDYESCRELESLVLCETERRDAPVIVDLGRAKFLPSIALGTLLGVKHKLDEHGRKLTIAGLGDNIRRALDITHLDRVFTLSGTYQPAAHA